MKFSIITVCFNSERTIARTIDSVLSQTYSDYEYIIVDGASKDGTLDIIDNYRTTFGEKLRVISEPDNGIYDAINKGIDMASGDLIGILNSDDYYEYDCLENVVGSDNKDYKYRILYGMLRIVDKQGTELKIAFNNHNNLSEGMINHPTCFVSRAVYQKFGKYSLQYKSASDYDFMIRMWKTQQVEFIPIYKLLSNFSIGGVSESILGDDETNIIRYRYNFITRKYYFLIKIKCIIKRLIG